MKISISSFRGIAPKIAPGLLPDSAGQETLNARMNSGALTAVNTPSLESNKMVTNAISVYTLGTPGSTIPLSWATDVDVANSPISDSEFKVYYTGDGTPKKTNLTLASGGSGPYPLDWYHWGVPAPTVTPAAGTTTGSVPAGTYSYLFTYVTQFGASLLEESAPSPAVTVTLGATGGVSLTGLNSPADLTRRNYVYKRIYRTTGTAFQLVAQVAFASTTYTDTLSATQILGDPLATATWIPPKDDLKGVHALASGVMVGFRNNEIWFSEPGFPHAWPLAYMQTVDSPIVGIKSYGNTLVVATQTYPYAAGGTHPQSFTFRKLPLLEPCLNKRSMASDETGVLYTSANGIVSIGDAGYGMATAQYISRESFAQYAPETFIAAVYERKYYGFYNSPTLGRGALVYAKSDVAPISKMAINARGATVDQSTARLLFISNDDGFLYMFDPTTTVPWTYTWKSKLFQLPAPASLGCFRITSSELSLSDQAFAANIAAQNAAIDAANASVFASGLLKSELNGHYLNELALNDSVMAAKIPSVAAIVGVTIWAGKNIIINGNYSFDTVYRIPSGFMTRAWEIGVTGQREVYSIEMATSPRELAVNNGS